MVRYSTTSELRRLLRKLLRKLGHHHRSGLNRHRRHWRSTQSGRLSRVQLLTVYDVGICCPPCFTGEETDAEVQWFIQVDTGRKWQTRDKSLSSWNPSSSPPLLHTRHPFPFVSKNTTVVNLCQKFGEWLSWLVSYCCYDEFSQIWWLNTANLLLQLGGLIQSGTGAGNLEFIFTGLKSGCQQDGFLLEALRGESVSLSFSPSNGSLYSSVSSIFKVTP